MRDREIESSREDWETERQRKRVTEVQRHNTDINRETDTERQREKKTE